MVIPDLVFSVFLALIISGLFAAIIRRKGPRRGFFWFFMIIFLAIFAAGIWGKPYGAPLTGGNWLPFLLSGLLIALLLGVLTPKYPEVKRETQLDRNETMEMLEEIEREKEALTLAYISLNIFFWIAIALLVAAIIARFS